MQVVRLEEQVQRAGADIAVEQNILRKMRKIDGFSFAFDLLIYFPGYGIWGIAREGEVIGTGPPPRDMYYGTQGISNLGGQGMGR